MAHLEGSDGVLPFDKKFACYDKAESVGLAVMVIKERECLFKKGYGLRNLETKEPIQADTNFELASVSKQFTAMCIAILEEQGKVSSDDYLRQYFLDLPEYMLDIKVSHLVHHMSGLPQYDDELWSSEKGAPYLSNQDVYDYYKKQQKLKSKPGDKFDYSNGGYSLLALLVGIVAGEPFPAFIERQLFKPVGMKNTVIYENPSSIKNLAKSYSAWPFFENIDFNTGNTLYGEGGIRTSLNDMECWIHALENNTLISAEMTKQVFSTVKANDGSEVEYGYGWGVEEVYKHKMILHDGSWVGFTSVIAHVPNSNMWFVVLANSRAVSAWDALEELFKYYLDIKIPG